MLNGDTLTGAITRIQDGRVRIKSSFGEVGVPWVNSSLILFANANQGDANQQKQKGLVRATLKGAGNLDFALISWEDGKLEVDSPAFGRVTLNGAIVESLTFNTKSKRNKDGKELTKKELKKLQREKEKGRGNLPPLPDPKR